MDSHIEEIKSILKEYRFLKLQNDVGLLSGELKEKLEFLVKCIGALDEESRLIMESVYISGNTVVRVSKRLYISRPTIYKRVNKILKQIDILFKQRFM